MDEGRRIRPWAWLLGGVVGILVGAVLGLVGLAALAEPDDISATPPCDAPFGDDCLTEREVVLVDRGYVRRAWLSREQRWYAEVPEGAPFLTGRERLRLDLPRQPGRGELERGLRARVVFYEQRAAVVDLPSGRRLETEDHPSRYAPAHLYYGLFGVGGGAFGVVLGWRTGRRHGFWGRAASAKTPGGLPLALTVSGLLGSLAHTVVGGRWSGPVGVAVGVALYGVTAVRRQRGRS